VRIICLHVDCSVRDRTAVLFGQQPWQTGEVVWGDHAAGAW